MSARMERLLEVERKHVAKLMEERDHARTQLALANARLLSGQVADALALAKTALEHASFALDGVVALDPEDEGKDGGSDTCQHAKRTVDRALKKVIEATQVRNG